MQILVEIGHNELFGSDLERMGFIAAALEMDLRKSLNSHGFDGSECPDVSLTAIIQDPHTKNTEIMKFTVGQGADSTVIPSYLTFLRELDL